MTSIVLDWQELLLLLAGFCLGILGSLYLAYDLSGRSEKLYRWVWVFSSGFLLASMLVVSCIFFAGPEHLTSGYLPKEIWRLIGTFSTFGFMMQVLTFSSVPPVRLPGVDRSRLVFWMVLSCLEFVGIGVMIAVTQGSSPVAVAIFALPGTLVYGLLNGFSSVIYWRVLHLSEKRVATIGVLLICGAFVLLSVLPLLDLLGIPL